MRYTEELHNYSQAVELLRLGYAMRHADRGKFARDYIVYSAGRFYITCDNDESPADWEPVREDIEATDWVIARWPKELEETKWKL